MNVHKSYQTITHYHFDWLTPAGDYPKSAIMVVECKDGRWMIVQEFGEDYGCFEGVLKNESDLITKPAFYPDLRSAAMSVFGMMKQIYPLYDDNLFNEFLSEIPGFCKRISCRRCTESQPNEKPYRLPHTCYAIFFVT
ncbi:MULTISPECIES: hypothetical protein [Klebsiella]|nr:MULTISPECIES: hypothetical protein [Enterobacteriaceae]MDI9194276.1 hypothetical protein [Raoultella ornithinolytica]MDI9205028.1 hypothetical protein [Raoultella ornithinolytica]MDO7053814.1 hypothetical protein [Klebsiella pneumoniae]MDO7059317.1 hypothetical protein [Klebsiella pneumoniae]MDO7100128.1 hypothetical protein [Klebsiella pneumoniae]